MGLDRAHEAVDGLESAAPAAFDGAEGGFDAAAAVVAGVPGFGVSLLVSDHLLERGQVPGCGLDSPRRLFGPDEWRGTRSAGRGSVGLAEVAAVCVGLAEAIACRLDQACELRRVVDDGTGQFPGENGFGVGVD